MKCGAAFSSTVTVGDEQAFFERWNAGGSSETFSHTGSCELEAENQHGSVFGFTMETQFVFASSTIYPTEPTWT